MTVSRSQPVLLSNEQTEAEPSAMADLLARVEGATEGSRELDRDLAVALYAPEPWRPERRAAPNAEGCFVTTYVDRSGKRTFGTATAEPYTTSLDAALALCSRVLPGGTWSVETCVHGGAQATVWPDGITAWMAAGKTPALSIVAAMLKAKIAGLGQ